MADVFRSQLLYVLKHVLNKDPQFYDRECERDLCTRMARNLGLSELGNDVAIESLLGRGQSGIVFGGTMGPAGTQVAIKVMRLTATTAAGFHHEVGPMVPTSAGSAPFTESALPSQVAMQRLMHAKLPYLIPQVFHAYVVRHYVRDVGVVIMARVDGVVHDLIAAHLDAVDLDDLADRVGCAVHLLEHSGFVHGDLHTQNIGYIRVSCPHPTPGQACCWSDTSVAFSTGPQRQLRPPAARLPEVLSVRRRQGPAGQLHDVAVVAAGVDAGLERGPASNGLSRQPPAAAVGRLQSGAPRTHRVSPPAYRPARLPVRPPVGPPACLTARIS